MVVWFVYDKLRSESAVSGHPCVALQVLVAAVVEHAELAARMPPF